MFSFLEELSESPVLNFACVVQNQLSVHGFIGRFSGIDNLNVCICKDFTLYFNLGILVGVGLGFCIYNNVKLFY